MPMNESPCVTRSLIYAGHANVEFGEAGAVADLCAIVFYFNDARNVLVHVRGDEVDPLHGTLVILGGRVGQRRRDLRATARERAEWIAKRDVIPIRKQCLVDLRVSIQYRGECEVALLDRSYEMTIEGRRRLRTCVSFAKNHADGSDHAQPRAFQIPAIQSPQTNIPPELTASYVWTATTVLFV
jgi:hypothetical protein